MIYYDNKIGQYFWRIISGFKSVAGIGDVWRDPNSNVSDLIKTQKPEEKKVIDPEMEALKTQIESIPIEVLKELVQKTNSACT